MARILLGWELGAGTGHAVRLRRIAAGLAADGHKIAVALQRTDLGRDFPAGTGLWQAPVWPRMLSAVGAAAGGAPATMGDILYRLGLDDSDRFAGLVAGWDALIAATRAELVVADFAPALLAAARGALPTVLVGAGFDTVPAHLERFPSLTGTDPAEAEADTLVRAQAALARSGRRLPDRLPALFAADRVLAGSFAELDPYASWRRAPLVAPSAALSPATPGRGEEVFFYGSAPLLRSRALFDGLVRARVPVRAWFPEATLAQRRDLEAAGFRVEHGPVPFDDIVRRSRIILSHGGLGLVSSALAAGLPQVIVHYDLEKRLTGEAVTRLRLGGHAALDAIEPSAFAASLRDFYADESFQRRAREAAPGYRARLAPAQEDLAVAAVREMVG